MSKIFVVNRAAGAGWKQGVKLTDQEDWAAHAEMMDQMLDDGFLLLAGPFGTPSFEAMIVVRADSEANVRDAFAADPWVVKDISRIVRVVPWNLRIGTLP